MSFSFNDLPRCDPEGPTPKVHGSYSLGDWDEPSDQQSFAGLFAHERVIHLTGVASGFSKWTCIDASP